MQSRLIITASASLTREFVSRVWPSLSTMFAAVLGIPALVAAVMRSQGLEFPPESLLSVPMHLTGLSLCIFGYTACILAAQSEKGFELPSRLFWLPLSDQFLIGLRSIQAAVVSSVMYAITVILLNRMFDLALPLWGPAVYAGVATLTIQAIVVSAYDFRFWKLGAWIGIVAAMIWWLNGRYDNRGYSELGSTWVELTIGEFITMVAFGVVMIVTSLHEARKIRSGESSGAQYLNHWGERLWKLFASVIPWIKSRVPRWFREPETLTSPTDSQIWLEWRMKGIALPLMTFFLAAGYSVIAALSIYFGETTAFESLRVLVELTLIAALFLSLVMGHVMGSGNYTHGANNDFRMRDFTAALPIDDRKMVGVMLRNSATAIALSVPTVILFWAIWATIVAVGDGANSLTYIFITARANHIFSALTDWFGNWFLVAAVVLTILAAWSITGITMSQTLTGRVWIIGLPYVFLAVLFLVWMPFHSTLSRLMQVGSETMMSIELTIANGLGAAIVAFVAACFVVGLKRKLITRRMAALCLLGTIVIGGLMTFGLFQIDTLFPLKTKSEPSRALLFYYGLCTLPAAPFATAPVALYFNRHR